MPPLSNTTTEKKDRKKSTKPRRTPRAEQSLLCYVQSLVNVPLVIVELRDDSVVRGTVVECDDCMHVTLKRCERVTIDREIREYEHLFIKNRTIRDVRINREEKGGTVSGEDVLPEASGARDERREREVRERNGWGCRAE